MIAVLPLLLIAEVASAQTDDSRYCKAQLQLTELQASQILHGANYCNAELQATREERDALKKERDDLKKQLDAQQDKPK
jgi:uncharacterized protein (DUF3084 family)